jgi:hypothetical protein
MNTYPIQRLVRFVCGCGNEWTRQEDDPDAVCAACDHELWLKGHPELWDDPRHCTRCWGRGCDFCCAV